jgi:hypothetical protein
MILVVVAWILVVIWTPANQRPSWPRPSDSVASQEKRFEDKIVLEKGKPVTIIVPVAPAWSPLLTTSQLPFSGDISFHSRATGKIWINRPNVGGPPLEDGPRIKLNLMYKGVVDFEQRYQAQGQEPVTVLAWID